MSRFSSSYSEVGEVPSAEIQRGTTVPGLSRSVGRLQLALYCASIRFAHQVHFDDELCRANGWDGVILPGFLMGNWCLEAVTRMLGPRSVVRSISFKMASVAYPNTALRILGDVIDVRPEADLLLVTCAMTVVGESGAVVTKATVEASVPTERASCTGEPR